MKKTTAANSSALESLMALPKYGQGIGLHRMLALCEPLLNSEWMRNLDALKVTGSNGKGSVCVMTAGILRELGLDCGLYISPHLLQFNERITINGRTISEAELAEACVWFSERNGLYQQSLPEDSVGAFEAFTSLALYYFQRQQPQALVIEAGIGGRYDPTRIIPGRIVGLTSLDLEHTELLGKTLDAIMYDKADLCPEGGTLVTGVSDAELLRRLQAYCQLRRVALCRADQLSSFSQVVFGANYMEVDLAVGEMQFPSLQVALPGFHQITNAAVAILLVQEWLKDHSLGVRPEHFAAAVRRALKNLHWPGRFELIQRQPDVYIDVGHTPEAIAALVRTVQSMLAGRKILLVAGVSYDKQVAEIVGQLLELADAVVCTRAFHKGSPPETIRQIVVERKPKLPIFLEPTITAAVGFARSYAAENDLTVLVAGGLFLSIEAKYALAGGDPQSLRFF